MEKLRDVFIKVKYLYDVWMSAFLKKKVCQFVEIKHSLLRTCHENELEYRRHTELWCSNYVIHIYTTHTESISHIIIMTHILALNVTSENSIYHLIFVYTLCKMNGIQFTQHETRSKGKRKKTHWRLLY